jgi:hypothetical protein
MPDQKKKHKKRRYPTPPAPPEAGQNLALLRRLPRPSGAQRNWQEPAGWREAELPNPAVLEIVELLRSTSELAGINPYVLCADWFGMTEAWLKFFGANLKAVATTGRVLADPPEVAEHFRRARERYLRAAEQRPVVYRLMQETFLRAAALLSLAAEPGLAWFARQTGLNPDLTGQVFLTLLDPGPAWRQFFPPWEVALAAAEARCPNGAELVEQALVEAAAQAKFSGRAAWVELEPGVNWAEWYAAVRPYLELELIGPAVIDSAGMMLAAAAKFPAWAVQHGLVRFLWAGVDPLLLKMANINAMLYGLNGYDLELLQTQLEIQEFVETRPVLPPPPDHALYLAAEPEETPPAAGATFEALFRQGGKNEP